MGKKLLEIGNELALLYGGSCYECKVVKEENKVIFYCIEHGENFCMVLTFDELKKDYGISL